MSGGIESVDQLLRVLGTEVLSEVERLDVKNRTATRRYKKKLKKKYESNKANKPVCAYCGAHDKPLDVSHIEPVEMGGQMTEANLILLCRGCHDAYDRGAISISKMKGIAKKWRLRPRRTLKEPGPVPEMTKVPWNLRRFVSRVRKMETQKSRRNALDLIAKELRKLGNNGRQKPQRIYIKVLQAEMIRRGAGGRSLGKATGTLEAIQQSDVPPEYEGYYCYERGYLLRLAGNHDRARDWMKQAVRAAGRRTDQNELGVDYVAASMNVILCELAGQSRVTRQSAKGFLWRIGRLAGVARRNGGYWGGRWELNCEVHTLQVYIRAGDKEASWRVLNKMVEAFEESDTKTGWSAADRQTVSLLKGVVYARFPRNCAELARGIGLLARSFMSRIKDDRQRPEGIRDAGMELAKALARYAKGDRKAIGTARKLERVVTKMVDGTSVLWPQRNVRSKT